MTRLTEEQRRDKAAKHKARVAANPNKYRALAAASQERYRRRHPDKWKVKARNRHYRRAYGMDYDDLVTMLHAQGDKCAICPTVLPALGGNVHVDHCHETGIVRGILCRTCNMQVGWFQRWPDFHIAAATYLGRTQ